MVDLMSKYLVVCERAAKAGGAKLLEMRAEFQVHEKSVRDLVTTADLASQQEIRQIVLSAFPDHEFIGEEDETDLERGATWRPGVIAEDRFRWIVDPLDGTANYVHGMPNFAVSIALQQGSRILVGVVYDPTAAECFTAVDGRGSFLNGARIQTSGCRRLDRAMVASGFSAHVQRGSTEITRFINVLLASQSVRRLGSAALNMCYVAAGRLDAYWATSVKAWDVAAGAVILREAGGELSRLDGSQFVLDDPELVAAATPGVQQELIAVLAQEEP